MSFAARHWFRMSAISILLLPVSLLFGAAVRLRRFLYHQQLLRSVRLPVPVLVVGNFTVGGTGKTPLVLWLVRQLRVMGRRPGIVSRGYGGKHRGGPRPVRPVDDPELVGDESVLLAQASGCPVWIAADRAAAGAALLAVHPECDVLVCDDGLQHYGLRRDVEIAVEDDRGVGNGLLLPAGPLREPRRRVDAQVANAALVPAGSYAMRLCATELYPVNDPTQRIAPATLAAKRLHAVAGIGNPDRFFAELERMGLRVVPHPFPDHHRFSSTDLTFPDCDLILMTEKDAVKCRNLGRQDLIAVRAEADPDPALIELIKNKIHGRSPA
jgi:tetraacyldisaccharide 4'-kinase